MPARDPDDSIIVFFKNLAVKHEGKSLAAGRPIYDDVEVCEMHYPGSKNVGVFPATSLAFWRVDETGEQVQVTYAERFPKQYRQFRAQEAQTTSGTPLAHVPFLTDGRKAELRALNVYTVEALAGVDGVELKNLGPGGRDLKNKAIEYIEEAKVGAPNMQMQAEIEALKARNTILEEDLEASRNTSEFDAMSLDQLREFITANTGHPPAGTLNRKTLLRMAMDARPVNA